MSERTRGTLLFVFAVVLSGASFRGGQIGNESMRNPLALVTLAVMMGAFLAILLLGSGVGRDQ